LQWVDIIVHMFQQYVHRLLSSYRGHTTS